MNPCNKISTYGTYRLKRSGSDVEQLLKKIEDLGLASYSKDGLMSSADKERLDNLDAVTVKYYPTDYWNHAKGYIPPAGEIIIYSDYSSTVVNGIPTYLPAIKIGSGNAYVQDLAFVTGADTSQIFNHINNMVIHITEGERRRWNDKLNIDDNQEVVEETLIFNRN